MSNFAIKADNGNMKIASIEPDKNFINSYNESLMNYNTINQLPSYGFLYHIIQFILYEIQIILYQLQRLKIQEKYYREANRS